MSEQDIIRIAKLVLAKIMNSDSGLVDYSVIEKESHVSVEKVRTVANQVCNWLLKSPRVEDVDICDDIAFDVMLRKYKTVK